MPTLPGYTALHLITVVRKPGVGDNDPAPEGSGTVEESRSGASLVARGANVNARMTKRPNLNNTRLDERGATPFLLAALTADAELMRVLVQAGRRPVDTERRRQHAADGRRRPGHAVAGEDAGTETRGARGPAGAARPRGGHQCRRRHGETAMHGAAYKNLPKAVRMLAAKGARIDVWNQPDEFGWTPLAIAAGYRFGNFKPSPETEAALREVMLAAGVTPPAVIVAKTRQNLLTGRPSSLVIGQLVIRAASASAVEFGPASSALWPCGFLSRAVGMSRSSLRHAALQAAGVGVANVRR